MQTTNTSEWLDQFLGWDVVPLSAVHEKALELGQSTKDVDALIRGRYILMTVTLTGVKYVKRPKPPSWICGP